MYREHKFFIIDNTKSLPLWRYMTFYKFIDIMYSSTLYFPNCTILGDQKEGTIPKEIFEMMKEREGFKQATAYKKFIENVLRKKTLILSWSAIKHESFALWKLYSKDKFGIALKTNFERLKNSFNEVEDNIYIGEVFYYDKEKPFFTTENTFYTFLNKNIFYKFENEVRCIIEVPNVEQNNSKKIKVDLNQLIEEIYISPKAEDVGYLKIIENLKEEKKLDFKIKISDIDDEWL